MSDGQPTRIAGRSAVWSLVWRILYRLIRLLDPVLRSWLANGWPGLDGVVELRTIGRRTGRRRRALVTLLGLDGRWYVGHPNGLTAWQRNAEAAGWLEIDPPAVHGARFAVARLAPGSERDAVIKATGVQQFFPANVVYRLARRHIAAVGVYHRLEPVAERPNPVADVRSAAAARSADHPEPSPEGAR